MYADKYFIDDKIVDVARDWVVTLQSGDTFRTVALQQVLRNLGVPWATITGYPISRAADRILRKLHKESVVNFDRSQWVWVRV